MNIQIRQIKGDLVELLFNPKEVDLRVSENLTLREKGGDRALIVQIIEFRTINYPSLLNEIMELVTELPPDSALNLADLPQDGLSEMSNLKLAIAKIRKVAQWTEPRPMARQLA